MDQPVPQPPAQKLAAADAAFNKQAYIGAFTGDYQFLVNVVAFLLQAFVSSRLINYRGLHGVLLAYRWSRSAATQLLPPARACLSSASGN
jgi:hypothetical protein